MATSLSFIIGIIGNVISILMFASPIKTFKQVVIKKSTGNYKGLPYLTTLLSTSLWSFYGILKPGGLLILTVNAAGATLHVVYVLLYLIYAAQRSIRVKYMKLVVVVNIAFLGGVIIVALLAFRASMRLTLVGILCAAVTIAMYAAPLSAMRTVIRTKSAKSMPFLLSFFQILNAGVWSAYAVLIKDYYIGVPNGIGLLLGSTQLILYMIYRNGPSDKMEEEGSVYLYSAIEMRNFIEDDEQARLKRRSLSKGNSLPKPSVIRQYSQNIMKTTSLKPNELENF